MTLSLPSESVLSIPAKSCELNATPLDVSSREGTSPSILELPVSVDRVQPQVTDDEPLQVSIPPLRKELEIFASTFFTIFLAELGDKTQLTTLLMSAESRHPWIVFAGAGSALIATTLLGVLLGRWLATRVSAKTLETAAGTLLAVIAVLLLWDVVKM